MGLRWQNAKYVHSINLTKIFCKLKMFYQQNVKKTTVLQVYVAAVHSQKQAQRWQKIKLRLQLTAENTNIILSIMESQSAKI